MDSGADAALRDFRAVYRAHYGLVWHALHRLGVSAEAIEDAVQDVFVVAYRRRDEYEGSSTKAWLYGIARRVAANHRRGDRRRVQRRTAVGAVRPRSAQAGAFEVIHSLDRYLSSLRAEDRELFILSELEGMTGPEIAEARGRKVQTIYTRIRKLRHELRADLGDVEEIRKARPRASAAGWAALVPVLGAGKAAAMGWLAVLGSKWGLAGAGVAAAAVATTLVVRAGPSDAPPEEGAPREQVTASLAGSPSESDRKPPPRATSHRPPAPVEAGEDSSRVASTPGDPERAASDATPDATQDAVVAKPERARASSPPAKLEAEAVDPLAEENALLRAAAQRLRDGDPDDAIAQTDEHARRFPSSALSDLRTALRIEALCQAGKEAQARGEGRSFLRSRPGSPVAERIEKSCAGSQEIPAQPDKPGT